MAKPATDYLWNVLIQNKTTSKCSSKFNQTIHCTVQPNRPKSVWRLELNANHTQTTQRRKIRKIVCHQRHVYMRTCCCHHSKNGTVHSCYDTYKNIFLCLDYLFYLHWLVSHLPVGYLAMIISVHHGSILWPGLCLVASVCKLFTCSESEGERERECERVYCILFTIDRFHFVHTSNTIFKQ